MALSLLIEHLKSYNVQQRRHHVHFAKLSTKIFRLSVLMLYRPVLIASLYQKVGGLGLLSLLFAFQDAIYNDPIRSNIIFRASAT